MWLSGVWVLLTDPKPGLHNMTFYFKNHSLRYLIVAMSLSCEAAEIKTCDITTFFNWLTQNKTRICSFQWLIIYPAALWNITLKFFLKTWFDKLWKIWSKYWYHENNAWITVCVPQSLNLMWCFVRIKYYKNHLYYIFYIHDHSFGYNFSFSVFFILLSTL